MINDIKNKYETYTISQNIVNRVISTIRHKYSNLTKNEIDNLVEEACNAYNEFVEENNNLKIIIPKFLIFYISKKIDYNFSKEDILIFMKKNTSFFERKYLKKNIQSDFKKRKKRGNNGSLLNYYIHVINERIFESMNNRYKYQKIKYYIKRLSECYPVYDEEKIAQIIINVLNKKITWGMNETDVVKVCKNSKINFFEVMDIYMDLYYKKQDLDEKTILLQAIFKIISPKNESVYMRDLSNELKINEHTFNDKYLHLSRKFPNIPKEILLNGVCDYYYIKRYDDNLKKLMLKVKRGNIDDLILEITLLRMEKVLTYEEAYEISLKHFKDKNTLLDLKYNNIKK